MPVREGTLKDGAVDDVAIAGEDAVELSEGFFGRKCCEKTKLSLVDPEHRDLMAYGFFNNT